jgi:cytidylate kinase
MIIAVDGPSAAGKGTVARAVARELGYHFLDTGSLYRMVGLAMLRAGKSADDSAAAAQIAGAVDPAQAKDSELRTDDVAAMASKVAVIPEVRAALLQFQRDFARRPPGAVLDGRDIGTVVCPDAGVKLYVTASAEERARRRTRELQQLGQPAIHDAVLADVLQRDARDSGRATAPLRPADDAVILDTSRMDIGEAVAAAMAVIRSRL